MLQIIYPIYPRRKIMLEIDWKHREPPNFFIRGGKKPFEVVGVIQKPKPLQYRLTPHHFKHFFATNKKLWAVLDVSNQFLA